MPAIPTATWYRVLEFFTRKRVYYKETFGNPAGNSVIADLMRFSRFLDNETLPADAGVYIAGVYEGRRQMVVRILQHLNLPSEKLAELHTRVAEPELKK